MRVVAGCADQRRSSGHEIHAKTLQTSPDATADCIASHEVVSSTRVDPECRHITSNIDRNNALRFFGSMRVILHSAKQTGTHNHERGLEDIDVTLSVSSAFGVNTYLDDSRWYDGVWYHDGTPHDGCVARDGIDSISAVWSSGTLCCYVVKTPPEGNSRRRRWCRVFRVMGNASSEPHTDTTAHMHACSHKHTRAHTCTHIRTSAHAPMRTIAHHIHTQLARLDTPTRLEYLIFG